MATTRTYAELVSLVSNWANRDTTSLPETIIRDSIRYAADKAYRTLRVPPLEATAYYSGTQITEESDSLGASISSFVVPADLIEIIQISTVNAEGNVIRQFDEKADVRTFFNPYAEKYNPEAVWTRKGHRIFLSTSFGSSRNFSGTETSIELYYYRRLPALDAQYAVIPENYDFEFITISTDATDANRFSMYFPATATEELIKTDLDASTKMYAPTELVTDTNTQLFYFTGNSVPNWLKDENERIVLMGALAECFAYLQEDDQAQKYLQLFNQEIAELNDEDVRRNAAGGNVQVNFNGRGLI